MHFQEWSMRPTMIILSMDQKEDILIVILGPMSLVFHEDSKNTTLQLISSVSPVWKLLAS